MAMRFSRRPEEILSAMCTQVHFNSKHERLEVVIYIIIKGFWIPQQQKRAEVASQRSVHSCFLTYFFHAIHPFHMYYVDFCF